MSKNTTLVVVLLVLLGMTVAHAAEEPAVNKSYPVVRGFPAIETNQDGTRGLGRPMCRAEVGGTMLLLKMLPDRTWLVEYKTTGEGKPGDCPNGARFLHAEEYLLMTEQDYVRRDAAFEESMRRLRQLNPGSRCRGCMDDD